MFICVVLRYNCPAQAANVSIKNEINERIAVTYDYSSDERASWKRKCLVSSYTPTKLGLMSGNPQLRQFKHNQMKRTTILATSTSKLKSVNPFNSHPILVHDIGLSFDD